MLLWDIFFSLFVLAPIVTGGVWAEYHRHFLEYTNPAPALLVMLLWLWLLKEKKVDYRESRVYRVAQKFWNSWELSLEKKSLPTILLSACLVASIWAFSSFRRHWNFNSGAADLGIFTNTIWHWSHGLGYICSVKDGINLLADHQSYIFLLFGPLYRIFPAPETLLAIQALFLSFGAVALFYLGRAKNLSPRLCALLPFLYWTYLPTRNANAFDFHPEVLLLPLSLGFLWSMETKIEKGKFFAPILFLLALATKESAAPVFVGIAISYFLQKRRRLALVVGAPALILFCVNLFFVPKFFHGLYAYSDVYSGGAWQLLKNLLHFSRLKFLWGTLAPFAFLPLLSPIHFLAALPGYAMLFLTNSDQRLSLGFHYSIEPSVGVFWALVLTLTNSWVKAREKIIFFVLVLSAILFIGRSEIFSIRRNAPDAHRAWLANELLPKLSPSVSVASSSAIVPHLANREWIDVLPEIQRPSGEPVDCILRDASVNNTPMSDEAWKNLNVTAHGYHELLRCGSASLYEKLGANCLTTEVLCAE